MRRLYLFILGTISCGFLFGQTGDFHPDMSRALFHSKLDKAQQMLLARDGKADKEITADKDEEINMQLTYQATTRLDNLQKQIEFDSYMEGNVKVGYIRGLTELITSFMNDLPRVYSWSQLPPLLTGFEQGIKLNSEGKSILAAVKPLPYRK